MCLLAKSTSKNPDISSPILPSEHISILDSRGRSASSHDTGESNTQRKKLTFSKLSDSDQLRIHLKYSSRIFMYTLVGGHVLSYLLVNYQFDLCTKHQSKSSMDSSLDIAEYKKTYWPI